MKYTSECGRSMLEMLAVIAVISVVTVGGASALSYQLKLFRASHIQNEVQEIIRGVTDLYAWNKNFDKLDMETICENDILSRPCEITYTETDDAGNVITDDAGNTIEKKCWENAFGGTIEVNKKTLAYTLNPEHSGYTDTSDYHPDRRDTFSNDQSTFTVTYTNIPEQACRQLVCYTKWKDARIISHENTSNDDCNSGCIGNNITMEFAPKTF